MSKRKRPYKTLTMHNVSILGYFLMLQRAKNIDNTFFYRIECKTLNNNNNNFLQYNILFDALLFNGDYIELLGAKKL